MRRMIGMTLVLAIAAAACGGDDAADPASLDSCEAVADASIVVLQDTLDIMDNLSIEELAALGGSDETPDQFKEIEAQGAAFEARAGELGCTEEEMSALLADRATGLSAESQFGQLILEGLKAGESGFFGG